MTQKVATSLLCKGKTVYSQYTPSKSVYFQYSLSKSVHSKLVYSQYSPSKPQKGEGLREGSNFCGVERVPREDVQIVPETLQIKSVESQFYRRHRPRGEREIRERSERVSVCRREGGCVPVTL